MLTAHPTEAKRLAVLEQHRALYSLMVRRENQMWTPQEQEAIRNEIKVTLERLWRTGEVHRTKPGVAEERRNVIYYLQEVFPSVLNDVDSAAQTSLDRCRISCRYVGFAQRPCPESGSAPGWAVTEMVIRW